MEKREINKENIREKKGGEKKVIDGRENNKIN